MNSNISRPLRIALTKGRLEKDTVALLEKLGYDCTAVHEKGRKLILPVGDDIEVVLAKAADVITYVENGVCDLGVVGKDTIIEMSGKFFELSDLGFGKCRFALAGKKGENFYEGTHVRTIATKYPNVARTFFEKKNMDVDIVKIEGSVELAPCWDFPTLSLISLKQEQLSRKTALRYMNISVPFPHALLPIW